jgi:hypothetical protein
MVITKEYIMANRTNKGAWTKPQIEALGIDWPPRAGWMDDVEGDEISDEMAEQFESKKPAKRKIYDINLIINQVIASRKFLSDESLARGIKFLTEEMERRL